MKKILNTLLLAAMVVAAVSCSYERKQFAYQEEEALLSSFPILSLVPQDAPAVFCLNSCAQGLDQVYFKAPFDSLDLGGFASSKAVLSFFYDGKLLPCLYLPCAPSSSMEDEEIAALKARMAERGIQTKLIAKEGCAALLLTISDYAVANQEYSMATGKSVLDAPGFAEALARAPLAQQATLFFSNKEASKLPSRIMGAEFARNRLASFLPAVAQWTVLSDESEKLYDISLSAPDDAFYFSQVFSDIKPAESLISDMLPKTTTLLLDLPLSSWKAYLRAYERWLGLQSRKRTIGKDSMQWAKMVKPQEIAFIHFARFRVLAVRAGSRFKEHEPAVNPYPGAVAELLGNAFQLNDDSVFAVSGKWIVIGSEEGVKAFLESSRKEVLPAFNGKSINFGIYRPGESIWDEAGLIRFQYGK